MTYFVLVPGALHCAAHFDKVKPILERNSENHVVIVDLPGIDVQVHSISSHVSAVVCAVAEAKKPVVLIGHSTAGRIITIVAEQCSACIDKLIFVAAETLPGALSFTMDPQPSWAIEDLFHVDDKGIMAVANGKVKRVGDLFCSGSSESDRRWAMELLRPSFVHSDEEFHHVVLDNYYHVAKAYVKCTLDLFMQPSHQDHMYARLGDGSFKFDLNCDHCPFVSCPLRLGAVMQEIADMSSVQFRPIRQLCEGAWQASAEEPALDIEILALGVRKRPHGEREGSGDAGHALAYRISKSRRDSTLAKVLKFPRGVTVGAPVFYWYDSYVDDPAQYTNAKLNVPERGHELSLDEAGVTRSLCAEGSVASFECSRVACSWKCIVTKVPGQIWARAGRLAVMWGLDGREWNGSFASKDGGVVEHLGKYTRGSVEAFWEDVPRSATDLLRACQSEATGGES